MVFSGISLPAPVMKTTYVQELPNLQEKPESSFLPNTTTNKRPTKLGRRNWDSEPALNGSSGKRRKKETLNERSASKSSLHSNSSMGEKEKSRAMQNVESKLMKAIKVRLNKFRHYRSHRSCFSRWDCEYVQSGCALWA